MSRLEERDQLLTMLGMLIRPIADLLDSSLPSDAIRHVRGRFRAEYPDFMQEVAKVCRPSEQLHYDQEFNIVKRAAWRLDDVLQALLSGKPCDNVKASFDDVVAATSRFIREIPTDDPSSILPPASPFSAYKTIRALCSSAMSRLELFDPYADADTLVRYLSEPNPVVAVRLITNSRVLSTQDDMRSMSLKSTSVLLKRERGDRYSLLINDSFHDRHLRVDDKVFHLGGSVKDAAHRSPYTIVRMEPEEASSAMLDALVAEAQLVKD